MNITSIVVEEIPMKTLKKLDLGNITKKKAESKSSTFPALVDVEASALAERIISRSAEIDKLDAALKVDKADLVKKAMPFYFKQGQNKLDVPSSVSVDSKAGAVLVTFPNRYKEIPDASAIMELFGDKADTYFQQSVAFSVDGDKFPKDQEKAQELLDELQALFTKHGCLEALSCKEIFGPKADFHGRRHLDFTPEVNLTINQVVPMVPMVKAKGVKA